MQDCSTNASGSGDGVPLSEVMDLGSVHHLEEMEPVTDSMRTTPQSQMPHDAAPQAAHGAHHPGDDQSNSAGADDDAVAEALSPHGMSQGMGTQGNASRTSSATPTRRLSVGSEVRQGVTCGQWVLSVAEEVAFSLWCRAYIALLLLSVMCFAVCLAARLTWTLALRMLLPDTQEFWTVVSSLHAMALLVTCTATLLDCNAKLLHNWLGMSRDTVHLFFLPNANYTHQAIAVRNAQLAALLVATLVGPCITAVIFSSVGGGAFSFVGVFAFVAFVVMCSVVAAVWLYMWFVSLRSKRRAWREGTKLRKEHTGRIPEGEAVPWMRRLSSNPLVMAEFGLDFLSVRTYAAHVAMGCVWVLFAVLTLGNSVSDVKWVAIACVVLAGALFLAYSAAKPAKRASKTARRQRVTTLIAMTCWAVFTVFGVIGAALSGDASLVGMTVVLWVMAQGQLVRRHSLHVTEGFVLPMHDDEEEVQYTRYLELLPCLDALRVCHPKSSCLLRKSRRTRERLAQETSVLLEHHCGALEAKLDKTQRVLTSDAKVATCFWFVFMVMSCVVAGIGGLFTGPLEGPVASDAVSNTTSTAGVYAACSMRWGTLHTHDLALMAYVTQHPTREAIQKDLASLYGAAWGVYATHDVQHPGDLGYTTIASTDNTTAVVVVQGGEEESQWALDLDLWGDSVLVQMMQALIPFTRAWRDEDKARVVLFSASLSRLLGRAPTRPAEMLKQHVAQLVGNGTNVVVTGHGTPVGHAIMHDLPVPVVTFGAPGTYFTDSREQSSHVNVQLEGSFLSLLDEEAGFVQQLQCGGGYFECQQMRRIACELLSGCQTDIWLQDC